MTTKATRDVIDLALRPVLNVDINGGNIDGTVIGITTPDEGYFTNLFAENLTVTGTVDFTTATIVGNLNAYYADIAEYYESDIGEYPVGTIVSIGGDAEITITTPHARSKAFGVITHKPFLVLNKGQTGIKLAVALTGRTPVLVCGTIKKGDRIVPSNKLTGVGMASSADDTSNVVGRALEDHRPDNDQPYLITAVVKTAI